MMVGLVMECHSGDGQTLGLWSSWVPLHPEKLPLRRIEAATKHGCGVSSFEQPGRHSVASVGRDRIITMTAVPNYHDQMTADYTLIYWPTIPGALACWLAGAQPTLAQRVVPRAHCCVILLRPGRVCSLGEPESLPNTGAVLSSDTLLRLLNTPRRPLRMRPTLSRS